ncbi:MAG: hypothetical protein ACI9G1_004016 [Pirellulaceae bacterium]|jgi:hypothetical protein
MKKHALGITALVIGILALGLAVVPGMALDRPLPFAEEPAEPEAGLTLEFNKFSFTIGGNKKDEEADKEAAAARAAEEQKRITRNQWLKWFTISAAVCSLIGLTIGPISWVREKQPALSGTAMGICCAALLWQYIVMGIVVGIAIIVLLALASVLAN